MYEVDYTPPGPVCRNFMRSDDFVRGLRGPFGSGKSGGCCIEIFRRMSEQAPNAEGKRKTRGAIIRNTYSELRDTTIKSWVEWFPEEHFGKIAMFPPPFQQTFRYGDVESEILFIALDREEDIRKLLSLELTWAWINEAREVRKGHVDAVTGRLRRYPAMRHGGPTWTGLIMDTNSPDDDHWWPIMAGETPPPEGLSAEDRKSLIKPKNWSFFVQPPAMLEVLGGDGAVIGYTINPVAENIANLDPEYYPGLVAGKTRQWINVYIMNRIGTDFDGRKVHPHFLRETHVVDGPIEAAPGHYIIGGIDFGLTPACIFEQYVMGQWRMLREIVLENAGADELGDEINRIMAMHYQNFQLMCWGDPAGDSRVGTDKRTPFEILRSKNIVARPTTTNDVEVRRASMTNPMKRMSGGNPGFIVSGQDCPILVKGLDGGWHYPRIRSAGGILFADAPAKNRYSHPCEAAEYGMQGGGEGRKVVGRQPGTGKQANARVIIDPLDRLRQERRAGRPNFRAKPS